MPSQPVPVTQPTSQVRLASVGRRKHVLLFSPDADLARFLILNLEDRLEIARVHTLEEFEKGVKSSTPDLVLIDLYTFSTDVVKQIDIIRRHAVAVPIIVLRAYVSLSLDMDRAIEELADHVFYKPVDVELITRAIEDQLK
jgi:DNA-binding NtrC family response regulator